MNIALDILDRAQRHGVIITPAGGTLKLLAEHKPPDDIIAALSAHKAEILGLLSGEVWTDEHEERAAQVEFDGGIPRAWAEGLARLDSSRAPADVPLWRWLRFMDDCGRFVDEWAWRASRLGWTPLALFGCDRTKPFARLDRAGLLWLVEGRRILALTPETAAIEISGGKSLIYRRKPYLDVEALAVWDLVT